MPTCGICLITEWTVADFLKGGGDHLYEMIMTILQK